MEQRRPPWDQGRDALESHGTRLERRHRCMSGSGVDRGGSPTPLSTSATATTTSRFEVWRVAIDAVPWDLVAGQRKLDRSVPRRAISRWTASLEDPDEHDARRVGRGIRPGITGIPSAEPPEERGDQVDGTCDGITFAYRAGGVDILRRGRTWPNIGIKRSLE